MNHQLKPIAAYVALLSVAFTAFAGDTDLDPVLITASRVAQKETEATYATEIHTRKMINNSNATTLYEYLSQNSSVNFASYFGTLDTPQVDMRGFGTANGFANVAITVDGRSLNNPDGVPAQLGAIPLAAIERIEISKGSGSVIYGDGATAGAINIITRGFNGASLSTVVGTRGYTHTDIAAGVKNGLFDVAVFAEINDFEGNQTNVNNAHRNQKNSSNSNNQLVKAGLNPTDALRLTAEAGHSEADTWFSNKVSLAQFERNPGQANQGYQARQMLDEDHWRVGAEYMLNPSLRLFANTGEQKKRSLYAGLSPYDYTIDESNIGAAFSANALDVTAGYQKRKASRLNTGSDTTNKENTAAYVQSVYRLASGAVSAGYRSENVNYDYHPTFGSTLSMDKRLSAWDIGYNHRISDQLNAFINYNKAYQAPSIDDLFYMAPDYSQVFNGFIKPSDVRTLNVGLNLLTERSKTKATVFHSKLRDEIYYSPSVGAFGANVNLDRSHKYGLELQHFWKPTDQLTTNLNYSFVHASIDESAIDGGSFNGKNLPGVPRHTVIASAQYSITPQADLTVSQLWRDRAYAANDFTNSFAQRQLAQASTNIGLRYRVDKHFEIFGSAENIFAHKNGIWIYDNCIYPVSWEPVYKLGLKAAF